MRMKKGAAILLVLSLLLTLLCGCGEGKEPEQTLQTEPEQTLTPAVVSEVPEETPAPAEPTPEPEAPEETGDPEMDDPARDWEPIDTKFGRLRYPDQFFDYLETEQTETNTEVKVLFRAAIGEKRIDLFEVTIGGEGETPVGTLTGPDGTARNVYLRFIEIEDLSGLSAGESNRVYAMQESLNFVIDNLR